MNPISKNHSNDMKPRKEIGSEIITRTNLRSGTDIYHLQTRLVQDEHPREIFTDSMPSSSREESVASAAAFASALDRMQACRKKQRISLLHAASAPTTYFAKRKEIRNDFLYANEATALFASPPFTTTDNKKGLRLDDYNNATSTMTIASFDAAVQRKMQQRKLKRRIRRSAILGAILGGLFALLLIFVFPEFPNDFLELWDDLIESFSSHSRTSATRSCLGTDCAEAYLRGQHRMFSIEGIRAYFDLFDTRWFYSQNSTNSSDSRRIFDGKQRARRARQAVSVSTDPSSSSRSKSPLLVVAGKMTVEGGPCNIAQYNLKTGEWSLEERIQLSLYNSYSGGEVYSLLANYTTKTITDSSADDDTRQSSSRSSTKQVGSGELIVVGAFDTTYRNSQVTYCSVGMWDGSQLSKVGEGLCNSALSKGMKITTASLAGPQDVYVAGSFQTQVWNGDRHEFVKIFNIAHFNAVEQVWLPLNVGQIACSWCTVTVLALAWDSKRRQLHVAGKFNAIDGRNVPAGLAIYDYDSGHLVAHPGGGLSMRNISQDGVGTALQLDEESGVLYVMGSFERLTQTYERCDGLAAYEIESNRWSCLADAAHTVYPTGGGNMLLTPYGLMVAGKTTPSTTWRNADRPYTIALLKATLKTRKKESNDDYKNKSANIVLEEQQYHSFNWSWLPGFKGHDEPLHALSNGFGTFEGSVFIAGDNMVARWSYQPASSAHLSEEEEEESSSSLNTTNVTATFNFSNYTEDSGHNVSELFESSWPSRRRLASDSRYSSSTPQMVPVTERLSMENVRGAIMAISQMMPDVAEDVEPPDIPTLPPEGPWDKVNITIVVYCVSVGCIIGVIGAILCNRNISGAIFPFNQEKDFKGFSLDTLTYSAMENTSIMDAYQRAMKTRYVHHPNLLTIIDPQEIFLQRIIGEGTFGRVWSARWRSASVAVKEFVFAQAAVAGRSSMQQEIVEEIIGEAGMMAILRHPNVLQLFGCSLTAQAIWIVSELCSLGSLRQLLDDNERVLPVGMRLSLALQVAEGMTYLHNQSPPIIHRDLKSHNIFVHETFTDSSEDASISSNKRKDGSEKMETHSTIVAKIGDWGSARATLSGSRTMTHGVGTACWLAPEVIKHARSSKFSDVYGYGIVLWELATREEVYQGLETTQIIAKVANENLRPPVPKDCPWKDIMVRCWAENPQDRLEFSEIVTELNDLAKRLQESTSSSGLNSIGGAGNSSVN